MLCVYIYIYIYIYLCCNGRPLATSSYAYQMACAKSYTRVHSAYRSKSGKKDSIHHHLLEVIFETATLPELRQKPLGGGGGGGGV